MRNGINLECKRSNKIMETLKTPKDLLEFVERIPAEDFCAYIRNNDNGKCCILGHIDRAFPDLNHEPIVVGLDVCVLASVNNHGRKTECWSYKPKNNNTSGLAIKKRLIKFLKSKV